MKYTSFSLKGGFQPIIKAHMHLSCQHEVKVDEDSK